MLTGEELAAMRAEAAKALPDTCTIGRPARTPDGMGGFTVAVTPAGSAKCRTDPIGTSSQAINALAAELGDKIAGRTLRMIALPYGADVRPGDRLTTSGVTYEVLTILVEGFEVTRRAVGAVHA